MSSTKVAAAKKSQPSIGPAEALEILESAIGYCRAAGLHIRGGTVNGRLILAIDGCAVTDEGKFVVASTGTVPAK